MADPRPILSRRAFALSGIALFGLGACAQSPGSRVQEQATPSAQSPMAGGRLAQTSTAAGAASDPLAVLVDDHRQITAMMDQALAARDPAERTRLLETLQEALLIHDVSEGMVIYPAMRQAGFRDKATEFTAEHGDIKTHLFQLGQMPPAAPQWTATLRELRRIVTEHATDEESRAFPQLRQALDSRQMRQLAVTMQRARAEVA